MVFQLEKGSPPEFGLAFCWLWCPFIDVHSFDPCNSFTAKKNVSNFTEEETEDQGVYETSLTGIEFMVICFQSLDPFHVTSCLLL